MSDEFADKIAIRETVENWVLWRDAGDWERFATVWHADGWMTATWFQGPAQRFIEVSREGFNRGVNILHSLGGFTCDVAGARAISQVKMTINQRASVDGVIADVVCTGRFYDFFEKRDGRWAIVRRQPIYERPPRPCRSVRHAGARRGTPRALPRRIPPPRVPAVEERLHREGKSTRSAGPGHRKAATEGKAWLAGLGSVQAIPSGPSLSI